MKFALLKVIRVEFPLASTVSKLTHAIPRVLASSVRRGAVLTTLYSLAAETLFANWDARGVLRFPLYETMECRGTLGWRVSRHRRVASGFKRLGLIGHSFRNELCCGRRGGGTGMEWRPARSNHSTSSCELATGLAVLLFLLRLIGSVPTCGQTRSGTTTWNVKFLLHSAQDSVQ